MFFKLWLSIRRVRQYFIYVFVSAPLLCSQLVEISLLSPLQQHYVTASHLFLVHLVALSIAKTLVLSFSQYVSSFKVVQFSIFRFIYLWRIRMFASFLTCGDCLVTKVTNLSYRRQHLRA